MLKTRIITALVLLALLLPALFYPSAVPFIVISLIMIVAATWEWGRLIGLSTLANLGLRVLCLGLCLLIWWSGWLAQSQALWWMPVGLAWMVMAIVLLRAGVDGWPQIPVGLRAAGGLLVLVAAWSAIAQARLLGINFLLSVLVLVWGADIGAYFAGKAFGKRKLAPRISPGKSWEGVAGGMLTIVIVAFVWIWVDGHWSLDNQSLYSRLRGHGTPWLLLGVLFLGAMSVAGDLLESLVKRAAGVKDSSALLPGHGGVLDRIDALLPVLPLAMLLVSL